MELVTSGLSCIDNAIGGGIVKGSNVLIIYDSFSIGWNLPFEILKHQISNGFFGVIINYNLPLPRLILRGTSVGLDIEKEGKTGNVVVIDVFGSKYGFRYPRDYVYLIEGFNPETYIPKLEHVYRDIFRRAEGRDVVDLVFSLDGMAFELGEERSIKIIKLLLSNRIINGQHAFSIHLLNRDRVSRRFLSWNIEFSDYVLEFMSKKEDHSIVEQMYVLKSPCYGFEPKVYQYRLNNLSEVRHR